MSKKSAQARKASKATVSPSTNWTPFGMMEVSEEQIQETAKAHNLPEGYVRGVMEGEVWVNNKYQVLLRRLPPPIPHFAPVIWLSIKRRDKMPARDWRDFQRIKNELVGPEYEAIELYPAESRLMDTSNQYHLYVIDDPTYRFPFGVHERLVQEHPGGRAKQRAFQKG